MHDHYTRVDAEFKDNNVVFNSGIDVLTPDLKCLKQSTQSP